MHIPSRRSNRVITNTLTVSCFNQPTINTHNTPIKKGPLGKGRPGWSQKAREQHLRAGSVEKGSEKVQKSNFAWTLMVASRSQLHCKDCSGRLNTTAFLSHKLLLSLPHQKENNGKERSLHPCSVVPSPVSPLSHPLPVYAKTEDFKPKICLF